MNKAARFAALGLSAALAGSCGSSSAPSKQAFTSKADAICKAEEAAINKLDHSDRARYLREGTAILKREVADLRALTQPKEQRSTLATWLGQLADTVKQADQAAKKAAAAPRKPHVVASKAKSSHQTTRPKKPPKGGKKATAAREGSKKAEIIALLEKPKGATLAELMRVTKWQAHSVRGFISGTLGKKLGLKVESAKREDGERVYSIKR